MTRLLSGPLPMWLFCANGMALGLAIDCRSVTPAALASLCTAGTGSLPAGFARHLALLPVTNIGMLLGGLASLCLGGPISAAIARINLACNAFMLIGMSLAGCLGPALAARLGIEWSAGVMMAAMTGGMTLGMMATNALYGNRPWRSTATYRPHPRPCTDRGHTVC
jgi:hypothetical protein